MRFPAAYLLPAKEQAINIFLSFFFLDRVAGDSGWGQTYSVAEDNLAIWIFLTPPPPC